MNNRQRILAVLNQAAPDRVPWFGDLYYWLDYIETASLYPQYRGSGVYQLYRDLGVGFYLQGYFPYKTVSEGILVETETHGSERLTRVKTPAGDLTQVEVYLPDSYCWAIRQHYVRNWRDLPLLRSWYSHFTYQPDYALAQARYELIGDNGVVLCYLPRSPFMELTAVLAGIETVTAAFMDAPDELEETLALMGQKHDTAAQLALESPAECLMIPENLSSEVVGKRFYRRFMQGYEQRWVDKIRAAGKYSFIHVDGTLKGLLREVSGVGFTVLEALTPAPVGDIPIEEMRSWVPGNSIIWGGLPGMYFTDLVSDADFDAFVIRTLEVMRSQPGFVLGVADQVPPGSRWERIQRVGELVAQYG